MLTDLEGAILSEVHHRGCETAFQVRRAFARSPSIEWRGSTGAIYPAVRRLEGAALIRGEATGEARRTRRLTVTEAGQAALLAWACDADLATGIGLDPFRLRASLWLELPEADWITLRSKLEAALDQIDNRMRIYLASAPAVERPGIDLALQLNRTRRSWIRSRGRVSPPEAAPSSAG